MKTSKKMTNQQIADLLNNLADTYQVIQSKNNRFRIIAYQNAAEAIKNLTIPAKDLWQKGELEKIPGIGSSIANYLGELFQKGNVTHFQKTLKKVPEAMFELKKVKGIGPKTAYKLCLKLKIKEAKNAVKRLKEKARQGEIRKLEGFGQESERQILRSIEEFEKIGKKKKRLLISTAEVLAGQMVDYLKSSGFCQRIDPLGSLRRKSSTVGDIDIAVATKKPKQVIDWFIKYPQKKIILEKGPREASIILLSGNQIDLITHPEEAYGSLLQHFTGSKEHNIRLRELALKKGYSLSEYGIKDKATGKIKKFKEEKKFYRFLSLDYIAPELRENTGEIPAAQKGKLPKLIKLNQVKGDLHLHSDFDIEPSHDLGESSMDQIVKKAQSLKYQYLCFGEHNPSQKGHTDQEIVEILKEKASIVSQKRAFWRKNYNVYVFNGMEIDIKPDGQLALPEKAFDYLDFAIASIHSSFNQEEERTTKRILKALDHPKVKILGHPTGRLIGSRPTVNADWLEIFKFCGQKKKALEINASPRRLDLPDTLVKKARDFNCKFVINSDAHHQDQMDLIRYGVYIARRGWLTSKEVINSWSLAEIKQFLKS